MPYSVSLSFREGKRRENHPSLVLRSLNPPASKKRKNLSTLVPNMRAKVKWPASWMMMSTDRHRMTWRIFIRTAMAYPFLRSIRLQALL